MPAEPIRYDILVQQALRGMVRDLLAEAAKTGLPGEHHFFITFDTTADGVRLSDRLREQYPQEMTIVLQYQFRDLKVSDRGFEVVLTFGGVPERLAVPLAAITGFADPSVQFALQFEALEFAPDKLDDGEDVAGRSKRKPQPLAARPAEAKSPAEQPKAEDGPEPEPPPEKPGAEVVRLDRFRKK